MGWDAYSSVKTIIKNDRVIIENDFHRVKFYNAMQMVDMILESEGSVDAADAYLQIGGLDCSLCGEYLEKATGRSVWSESGWTSEEVKEINKEANWDFDYPREDSWAYYSAKHFLETCAELDLCIKFSW